MPRPRTVDDAAVLAAAARAVERVGPARVTLADVAADAGLSPATLVQRFGSKRGLLLAVARRGAHGRRPAFAAARAAAPTRLGALADALVALTAGVRTPEAMANGLAFLQLDLADAEFHAEALAGHRMMREEIASLLAEAQAAGELAAPDVDALAETVQTAYNGALITWAIQRDGELEAWLRRQLDAVVDPYRTRRPLSAVE
jgi:AcrR family transcriptional regulator